jgi:hypothetical protein
MRLANWILGGCIGFSLVCAPGLRAADNVATPPVPVQTSPVDYFRQLLAAKGEEREKLLTRRPAQREQFRAFLQEYEQLTSDERESRLQALDLRFQITSIIRLPSLARTQAVARLPESSQSIVKARVDYWNQLAPDVQQIMLENSGLLSIVTVVSPGQSPKPDGNSASPAQLSRVESAVRNWRSLPEG